MRENLTGHVMLHDAGDRPSERGALATAPVVGSVALGQSCYQTRTDRLVTASFKARGGTDLRREGKLAPRSGSDVPTLAGDGARCRTRSVERKPVKITRWRAASAAGKFGQHMRGHAKKC